LLCLDISADFTALGFKACNSERSFIYVFSSSHGGPLLCLFVLYGSAWEPDLFRAGESNHRQDFEGRKVTDCSYSLDNCGWYLALRTTHI
jgi:hypothetical protein